MAKVATPGEAERPQPSRRAWDGIHAKAEYITDGCRVDRDLDWVPASYFVTANLTALPQDAHARV